LNNPLTQHTAADARPHRALLTRGDQAISPPPARVADGRCRIHGRSLLCGGEKLHVRGVTYGTFRPADGSPFPARDLVRRDFEAMAAAGT